MSGVKSDDVKEIEHKGSFYVDTIINMQHLETPKHTKNSSHSLLSLSNQENVRVPRTKTLATLTNSPTSKHSPQFKLFKISETVLPAIPSLSDPKLDSFKSPTLIQTLHSPPSSPRFKSLHLIGPHHYMLLHHNTGSYTLGSISGASPITIPNPEPISRFSAKYPKIATLHGSTRIQIIDLESHRLSLYTLQDAGRNASMETPKAKALQGAEARSLIFAELDFVVLVVLKKVMVWKIGKEKSPVLKHTLSIDSSVFFPVQSISRLDWPLLMLASGSEYQIWDLEEGLVVLHGKMPRGDVNRWTSCVSVYSHYVLSSVEDLRAWSQGHPERDFERFSDSGGMTALHAYDFLSLPQIPQVPQRASAFEYDLLRVLNADIHADLDEEVRDAYQINGHTSRHRLLIGGDLQGRLAVWDMERGALVAQACTLDSLQKDVGESTSLKEQGKNKIKAITSHLNVLFVAQENCYLSVWTLDKALSSLVYLQCFKLKSPALHLSVYKDSLFVFTLESLEVECPVVEVYRLTIRKLWSSSRYALKKTSSFKKKSRFSLSEMPPLSLSLSLPLPSLPPLSDRPPSTRRLGTPRGADSGGRTEEREVEEKKEERREKGNEKKGEERRDKVLREMKEEKRDKVLREIKEERRDKVLREMKGPLNHRGVLKVKKRHLSDQRNVNKEDLGVKTSKIISGKSLSLSNKENEKNRFYK